MKPLCILAVLLGMSISVAGDCPCGYDAQGTCIACDDNPDPSGITYDDDGNATITIPPYPDIVLPDAFFNDELPFIQDFRTLYQAQYRHFFGAMRSQLFDVVHEIATSWSEASVNSDLSISNIEKATRNAEIYLADIVYSKITGASRRFSASDFDLVHTDPYPNLPFLDKVANWYDVVDPFGEKADKKILALAPYITHITLLSFLDKEYHKDLDFCIGRYVITSYLRHLCEDAAIWYDNNNIVIKGYSACALSELPFFDSRPHPATDKALSCYVNKIHGSGRYSEGTDYLNYLNGEFLPFVYFGMYCEWFTPRCLSTIKNTGNWLLNIADPSCYFPEIDDAVGGRGYWIAPYEFICSNDKFAEAAKRNFSGTGRYTAFRDTKKSSQAVFHFLTYAPLFYSGTLSFPSVGCYDGIGKINFEDGTGTTSITMVTQTADSREKADSHDQQDHGSITIRRSTSSGIDYLLVDPLYANYERKLSDGKEALYENHNTLICSTPSNGGSVPCRSIDPSFILVDEDARCPLSSNKGIFPCQNGVFDLFIAENGGGTSDIVESYTNGLKAAVRYDFGASYASGISDPTYHRSVVQVEGILLVFDRVLESQPASLDSRFGLNYNLPHSVRPQSIVRGNNSLEANGVNNLISDNPGHSRIRLSAFCSVPLDPVAVTKKSYYHRDRPEAGRVVDVNRARFWTANRVDPEETALAFLTAIETGGRLFNFGADFETVLSDAGEGVILVRKALSESRVIYAFMNSGGTTVIPPIEGKHYQFQSDADFGAIQFDLARGSIVSCHLYGIHNSNSYNEVVIPTNSGTEEVTIERSGPSRIAVTANGSTTYVADPDLERPDLVPVLQLLLLD